VIGGKERIMVNEVRILEIKKSVYENNDKAADELRAKLRAEKTFLLNLMSSPGSGKTSLVLQTIRQLADRVKMGVMEADIDSAVDAEKVAGTGVAAIQLHTGGMCHLDAGMTASGLEALGTGEMDFVILENVGNLVCPAEFDTGASKSAMILSVPEGDDKPLKYPLMFSIVDALVINKIDVLSSFEFDIDAVRERAKKLNPDIEIFVLSAKTGEGVQAWTDWLFDQISAWNQA
jgi:hydrogenase nickel incorporation protein HypB